MGKKNIHREMIERKSVFQQKKIEVKHGYWISSLKIQKVFVEIVQCYSVA